MEIIPNWHPILVHFTVALFTVSTLLFVLSKVVTNWRIEDQWLATGYWNLWIGTLVTLGTVAAGWYAFNTVDHDTESHKVMLEHRNYAFSALAVFVVLSVWAIFQYRAEKRPTSIFIIAALLGWGLVMTTGWHGAELVYRHGLGVMSLPEVGPHSHGEGTEGHSHGDEGHSHGDAVSGGDAHHEALGGDDHPHGDAGGGDHHAEGAAAAHSHDDAPAASEQAAPAPADPAPAGGEGAETPPAAEAPASTPEGGDGGAVGADTAPAEGAAAPADPAPADPAAADPAATSAEKGPEA